MVEERKDKREEDKKTKKESDLKKFLKKAILPLSYVLLVAFVVIVVPDMIAQNDVGVVVWVIPSTAPDLPPLRITSLRTYR